MPGSHPAGSNVQQDQNSGVAKVKALLENLVYPDGEIPVSMWSVDNARLMNGCLSRSSTKMMLTPGS
jgi:hypothetical protein